MNYGIAQWGEMLLNLYYVMISMYKDHVDFLYFQLVYPSTLAAVSNTTLCSMLLKTRH